MSQLEMKNADGSTLMSRGIPDQGISFKKCMYCKKNGHTIDFCYDLHTKKKNIKKNEDQRKNMNFNSGEDMIEEKRKKLLNRLITFKPTLDNMHMETQMIF